MDRYFFNYMCLNYFIPLTNANRVMITNYFVKLHLINWKFVDQNRDFFKIHREIQLPIGEHYEGYAEKTKDFYYNIEVFETNYVTPNDLTYPRRFNMFSPLSSLLFYKGNRDLFNIEKSVAVVGTRKPSPYGKKVAYELCKYLAEQGIHVISGMALGIDGAAHEGALSGGGMTTAVLASGVNQPYPASHDRLYHEILNKNGLIVSELGLKEMPMKHQFPLRNRLISGLADAVVIIEASHQSGSLITAKYGLEQNKMIFAVPGNIFSKGSQGTNQLIYDGASPLICFEDIVRTMGWESAKTEKNIERDLSQLSEDAKKIYKLIEKEKKMKIGEIVSSLSLNIASINSGIGELLLEEICTYISIDEIQLN